MKDYLVTAGSLLLLTTASCVFAWHGPGNYSDRGYAPGGYGGGYPMHRPFEYGIGGSKYRIRVPRIYMEKARYEDGYLLRVYTESIKAEDVEVLADRVKNLPVMGHAHRACGFHAVVDVVVGNLTTWRYHGDAAPVDQSLYVATGH